MELNEALKVVHAACAAFVGTLADHQKIQTALAVIERELAKPAIELAVPSERAAANGAALHKEKRNA